MDHRGVIAMQTFSAVRILVILVYFLICTACGSPGDQPAQADDQSDSNGVATDINFIGGGTQSPDIEPEEEEYRSPTLSTDPAPTELTWLSTIEQAVRMAENDNLMKICVFFHNADCVDCPVIERDVLTDPEVISNSRNWLFVKIDTGRNPDRTRYYLQGADPPAFVFLDKLGNQYKKYIGTVSVDEFVTMLTTWR